MICQTYANDSRLGIEQARSATAICSPSTARELKANGCFQLWIWQHCQPAPIRTQNCWPVNPSKTQSCGRWLRPDRQFGFGGVGREGKGRAATASSNILTSWQNKPWLQAMPSKTRDLIRGVMTKRESQVNSR